jgi:molybdopterin/thiamine biosynthesis adenylyltransferase
MQRPRIKFSHRPVLLAPDRVRIGGVVQGVADVIEDPDGWVWALLELLDGSRTGAQVAAELHLSFPHRPAYEVPLAIGELVSAGHMEDADEPEPDGLTEGERERYSRGRELSQWMDRGPRRTSWEGQMMLKQAEVVVLGLGGVGSTAALALTASGVGHMHCVDRDVVGLSDLNRQVLYTEQDLGHPKVEAAVRRLHELNSDVLVTGERRDIDGPEAAKALATGFDVVVLAADNPAEIRSWINRAYHETGTPWVLGGYHGPLATVGLYRPGTGPCYDCARTTEQDRLAGLPPRTGWSPAVGIPPPHAASAITAGITGHLAAHAVISLLTGVPALPVNRQYMINLVTLQESVAVGPDATHPRCPTCGPHR